MRVRVPPSPLKGMRSIMKYMVALWTKETYIAWHFVIDRKHRPTHEELDIIRIHYNRENEYVRDTKEHATLTTMCTWKEWKRTLRNRGYEYDNLFDLHQEDCDCLGFCTGACYERYK